MAVTSKGYIIIAILVFAVIGGVIFAASSGNPKAKTKDSDTITVTVLNNIGIDRITIKNMNTGDSIVKTIIDLPYSFNVTRGAYLRIQTTVNDEEFQYNALQFQPGGTFDNANPATFIADGGIVFNNQIIIEPQTIFLEISPTDAPLPTATPQPTASPTPTPEPVALQPQIVTPTPITIYIVK